MNDKELEEFLRQEWEDALEKAQDGLFQVALEVIAELNSAMMERRSIRENYREGLQMMLELRAALEARNTVEFARDFSKIKPQR